MDKKILAVVLSFFLFFGFSQIRISQSIEDNCTIVLKYQVGNKQYYVGNSPYQMDSEPEVKDSRMFLVIRFVTQHIPGTTLEWEGTERKVTITTSTGKTIRLWIGSPKAEVNGKMVLIDPENPEKIVPYIKDGRTKLPMRFVGEQLDASIEWIAASRTVTLTVQDTYTCSCQWLEGCIVQWTEAPNHQYQLSFVLNCDKKSNLERYLIEKNLKSMSEGVDLIEYLKKYPKPPYPTTKICVNQAKKIIKWEASTSPGTNPPPPPDPPEPPEPPPPPNPPADCCTYELFQLTQTLESLKPGQSYFYIYQVTNTCPPGTKDINIQLAPISNITEINPKNLILTSAKEQTFKVSFTMPQDCANQTKVTFSFKLGTDCSDKEVVSFMVQCDSPPAPPPEPSGKWICGCFSQFNSESADGTKIWLNASCSEPEGMWKTYMIPKNLKDQNLDLVITEYMTKYPLKKFKSLCIELYVDNKGAVEKWKANPEKYTDCCQPPEQKGPGRIIVSLGSKCAGVGILYGNLTRNEGTKFGEANIKGDFDTECILFFGDTYRIQPRSPFFTFTPEYLDVKIIKSCPDGIQRASFDAVENPPSCCKWQFRLTPETPSENWTLAPGDTEKIEVYEVINTCSLNTNQLLFTIDWPGDGKVVSVTPKTFMLKPSERQLLKITIKMPEDSVADEIVTFPFTITPSGCEKKEMQLSVRGKRFLCKNSILNLEVKEVNWKEGWIYGVKLPDTLDTQGTSLAVPVRIFFTIGDDFWEKIQINHRYKICYDERNDSSGKLIKWGQDYRKIE